MFVLKRNVKAIVRKSGLVLPNRKYKATIKQKVVNSIQESKCFVSSLCRHQSRY